jgi:hypothetical protein
VEGLQQWLGASVFRARLSAGQAAAVDASDLVGRAHVFAPNGVLLPDKLPFKL